MSKVFGRMRDPQSRKRVPQSRHRGPQSWVRNFLTAEEVPRWFGLSIILIYLVGLGAVARWGIVQAKRETAGFYEHSTDYAVDALLDRLAALDRRGLKEKELAIAFRPVLREFAASVPVTTLRVFRSDGTVVASIDPREASTSISTGDLKALDALGLEVRSVPSTSANGTTERTYRARVALHGPPSLGIGHVATGPGQPSDPSVSTQADSDSSDSQVTAYYLEARLPADARSATRIADQLSMVLIVFIVLGALFVVYRCLREQMRGMSRIAQRLSTHRERLSEDLSALRISDLMDTTTTTWNELIDMVQCSVEAVNKSSADEELSRVLAQSGGGALAEALHSIPDGVIYIADEVRFDYVNSAARRLLGWTQEDVKAQTVTDRPASAEPSDNGEQDEVEGDRGVGAKVLDLLGDALQNDGTYLPRNELIAEVSGDRGAADGAEESCFRVAIIPLLKRSNVQTCKGCVVMIRDVTQQNRAERAREELITQVTHELRTPLTNIRAYAETLSSGMFDDPKVVTECYNVITKETRRLSRLIEDMLSMSEIELGGIELELDRVDIKALLSDGVRDLRGLADDKNIDVQLRLPAKLEPIEADRDKLAVVINNLLGNAIKYTPADGIVIVGCQVTEHQLTFTLKDNGLGIDPAEHAKVFEKFYRAADSEVREETGTGIGLYTAREIVRRHGGEIDLISAKGEGSTFMVRLPRRETRATVLNSTHKGDGHGENSDRG